MKTYTYYTDKLGDILDVSYIITEQVLLGFFEDMGKLVEQGLTEESKNKFESEHYTNGVNNAIIDRWYRAKPSIVKALVELKEESDKEPPQGLKSQACDQLPVFWWENQAEMFFGTYSNMDKVDPDFIVIRKLINFLLKRFK